MVATPDSRWRRLSAVRSAVRIERLAPATSATSPPSRQTPSSTCARQRSAGSTRWNTASATRSPAITPGAFCVSVARPLAPDGTSVSMVTSPLPTSSSSARSIRSFRSVTPLSLCGRVADQLLHHHAVAPLAVQPRVAPVHADLAEAEHAAQRKARLVLGEDPAEQLPVAAPLALLGEGLHRHCPRPGRGAPPPRRRRIRQPR